MVLTAHFSKIVGTTGSMRTVETDSRGRPWLGVSADDGQSAGPDRVRLEGIVLSEYSARHRIRSTAVLVCDAPISRSALRLSRQTISEQLRQMDTAAVGQVVQLGAAGESVGQHHRLGLRNAYGRQ